MKNKLVILFVVMALVVYAVGAFDVTIRDTLSDFNDVNVSGNLTVSDVVLGNADNVAIGGDSDGHSLTSASDLFVLGKLEIDGVGFFDGAIRFTSTAQVDDGSSLFFGSNQDARMVWQTAQTLDALMLTTGPESEAIIITQDADQGTDVAHSLQLDPTIFMHGNDITTATEWMSMGYSEDLTEGQIGVGADDMKLGAIDDVIANSNFNAVQDIEMGDPDNYLLFEQSVNGTDVILKSYQSMDIYIDSNSNIIRVPTATNITWDNGAKIWVNATCIVLSSPDGSGESATCNV